MPRMGDNLQILLSRPGGQPEGPFTLEQINRDLAAKKYRETDYWAWHEGLSEWVPLHALPGISITGPPPAPAVPPPTREPTPVPAKPPAVTAEAPVAAAPAAPTPAATLPEQQSLLSQPEVASGMPFTALEHIFAFTTGEGPLAWQSPTVTRMLERIIGTDLNTVRQDVPRDVVAYCAVGELLKPDGSISDAVWRAMAVHQPALVQQARERLYHVCVRTFRIEADTVVALVLFYNKQKL